MVLSSDIEAVHLERILVLDGDPSDRQRLCDILQENQYQVSSKTSGECGLELLSSEKFDLIITKSVLPDMSGIELTQQVRNDERLAPVRILLVADAAESGDMVRALDSGADDFLVKPVEPEVFAARVRAALRRPAAIAQDGFLRVGPVTLVKASHMVRVGSQYLQLSPVEYRLLLYFLENPGRVHEREELLSTVWSKKKGISERTVDVHVRRLRASLEPCNCQHMLKTVRGVGYIFG